MSRDQLNLLYSLFIFSLLGVVAYIMLATSANLPVDIDKLLSYGWGYLFFVAAFNILGFSIIKLSNWVGRYIMHRWKMILLYSCVAVLLLLITYGLLVSAKLLVGLNEPYLFPNGGYRVLLLVWLVDLIIVGLMIANNSVLHVMKIQKEAARLQNENNKAHYMALQNQLNPHFLFNSLNTLIAEIEYDPQNAVLFTRSLSEAYRYVLQCQSRSLVPLREELDFMRAYIFLHKVRLGDYINVDCQIEDHSMEAQVPPLTLQLLAENVIKHNSITSAKLMTITISIQSGVLVVSNSVNLKKNVDTPGTGLNNLSNRCQLIIGKEIVVLKEPNVFTVKIPMLYD